jgi:predicted DNA-binding protein
VTAGYRTTTIRLPADQANEVELASKVLGIPAARFMRNAVAAHLDSMRSDPKFQEKLQELVQDELRILNRLSP